MGKFHKSPFLKVEATRAEVDKQTAESTERKDVTVYAVILPFPEQRYNDLFYYWCV